MWFPHLIVLAIACLRTVSCENWTEIATIQLQLDVPKFLSDNGFKFVTLIENSTMPSQTMSKITGDIVKRGTSRVRTSTMNAHMTNYAYNFIDANIFIYDIQNDDLQTFLHYVSLAPVRSSVIVTKYLWTESMMIILRRNLDLFRLNALFYFVLSSHQGVTWYQVTTLKSGFSMTELIFSLENGQIVEDYDLNGLTVNTIGLNYAPYFTLKNCDQNGRKCRSTGYMKQYMDVLAQQFNFTYESHKDANDDWGGIPTSGPYNCSGEWGGVFGDVIMAKYDLNLAAWVWSLDRYGLLSFVSIISITNVLMWTPKTKETDFGFFLNPFTYDSWIAILSMTTLTTIVIAAVYCIMPSGTEKLGQNMMITTLWYFFILLNAFYGGAMTMFFTSNIDNHFGGKT
jgi:hypothetical protein